MKAYFHVRDKILETTPDGLVRVSETGAFGSVQRTVTRQGIKYYEDGWFPGKDCIHLFGNCFETRFGFSGYVSHVKSTNPTSPELPFLEALRPYVEDEQNLPLVFALSDDSCVDKILEQVGFIPLETRV